MKTILQSLSIVLLSCLSANAVDDIPPNTPPKFARAANSYAMKRGKALEGILTKLKSKTVHSSSTINSAIGELEELRETRKRNFEAIKKELDKFSGAEKEALKSLLEHYNHEYSSNRIMMDWGRGILESHAKLRDIVNQLDTTRRLSVIRRKRYVQNAAILTRLVDNATKAFAIKTAVGSEAQQGAVVLNALVNNHAGHLALAEFVDRGIRAERKQIENCLSDSDPRIFVKRVGRFKSGRPFAKESPEWSAYKKKFVEELEDHVDDLNSAHDLVKKQCERPLLDFYVNSPKAALNRFLKSWEATSDELEEQEKFLEEVEQAKLKKERETKAKLDKAEDEVKRLINLRTTLDLRKNVLAESVEEETDEDEIKELEDDVEVVDERIESTNESLKEQLELVSDLKKQLKELD